MATVASRDEIQGGAIKRVERRVNRLAANHGDRRRRHAVDGIGVVGRWRTQVGAGDAAVVALAHTVDDGGVGLQAHAHAQPAHEHAGNLAALFGYTGFLLDHRGHDQRIVGLAIGQTLGAFLPLLGQYALKTDVGLLEQVLVAHAAHVAIGIGEETPFRILPGQAQALHQLGIGKIGQALLQTLLASQSGAHLAEVPALDQGQAVLHHLTALPQAEHVAGVVFGKQAVFAAVHGRRAQIEAPVQTQPEGVVDHALRLQAIEQAARRGAGRHLQEHFFSQMQRLLQRSLLLPGGTHD